MDYLSNGPESATRTLVLAHGAGVGMYHPSMATLAEGIAANDVRVIRFEFPYMVQARTTGRRGRPDPPPVLIETWREAVAHAATLHDGRVGEVIIGGRSMGGRIASMVADELGVGGLICFAYPFHPAGRPERLRTRHLAELSTPTLILQGTRDPLGSPEEIVSYRLSSSISVHYLEDGDHSFTPRKSSGRSHRQNLDEAVQVATQFIHSLG